MASAFRSSTRCRNAWKSRSRVRASSIGRSIERGKPKGGLEKLGKVNNRRGTRVRFKPDPEIFGAKAKFNPQRVFKMARAKAYLFGGVEIRWSCDKELLKGTRRVPPSETFHFAEGLKDFVAREVEGQTLVHPEIFTGTIRQARRQRRGRMGGGVERGRRRLRVVLLQHRSRRRTAAPTSPACARRCCAA